MSWPFESTIRKIKASFTQDRRSRAARRRAHEEALLDVKDGREGFITEDIGSSPADLAKPGLQFREAQAALAETGRRNDLEQELRSLQELQSVIGHPFGYAAALVAATVVEAWGMVTLLRSLDWGGAAERPYLAVGLAIGLVVMTKMVAETAGKPARRAPAPAALGGTSAPTPAAPSPPDEAPEVPWRALAAVGGYAAVVAALVVMRVAGHATEEEGITAQSLAEGVLTVVTTVGPAWLTARMAARHAPAKQLAARIALVAGRLRAARRKEEDARRFLMGIDAAQAEHIDARARTGAAFDRAHERSVALRREGLADPSELEGK